MKEYSDLFRKFLISNINFKILKNNRNKNPLKMVLVSNKYVGGVFIGGSPKYGQKGCSAKKVQEPLIQYINVEVDFLNQILIFFYQPPLRK